MAGDAYDSRAPELYLKYSELAVFDLRVRTYDLGTLTTKTLNKLPSPVPWARVQLI